MNDSFIFSVLPVDNIDAPLIGREFEIDKIKNAILKFQNVSIVGDIKVGKTSILKTIEIEVGKDQQFENIIPVFIDLEKNSYNLEIKELLRRIINKIFEKNKYLEEKYENSILDKREVFSLIVDYCTRKKFTILLLLDNFDTITVLNNLNEEFFTFLRGNASETGLSIITASRSKLETLCHKGQIPGSYFWAIFYPVIPISVFEDIKHARELLSRGINNERIRDLIISFVGVHPCFLKVAANAVIEKGLNKSENEQAIKLVIYEKVKPYYEKCLKLLVNDDNSIDNGIQYKLEYVSILNSICYSCFNDEITEKREFTNLKEFGYIKINQEGKPEISSPLFTQFLKEQLKKPIPYSGEKPYLFISYAHADKVEVLNILQNLMNNNYRFWFDEGIVPGNEWREEIVEALKNAHTFLVFISPQSIISDYVQKEILYAIHQKKQILPVYLSSTSLTGKIDLEIGPIQAIKKYKDEGGFLKNLMEAINLTCKEST